MVHRNGIGWSLAAASLGFDQRHLLRSALPKVPGQQSTNLGHSGTLPIAAVYAFRTGIEMRSPVDTIMTIRKASRIHANAWNSVKISPFERRAVPDLPRYIRTPEIRHSCPAAKSVLNRPKPRWPDNRSGHASGVCPKHLKLRPKSAPLSYTGAFGQTPRMLQNRLPPSHPSRTGHPHAPLRPDLTPPPRIRAACSSRSPAA